MTEPTFDLLLGDLYDAVTAPAGFQRLVEQLVGAFDLKAAMMFTHNTLNGESKGIWVCGLERPWLESYATTYGVEDTLARHLAGAPIAHFYASNLHLDARAYTGSRFFREWVVPQGVACAAAAVVLREGVWCTQVVLQRSTRQAPFGADELARLDRLIPHLQRAVQMRQRFIDLHSGQSLLLAGLDALAMPAIMFDEGGCVAHHNRAAAHLLNQRSWLRIEQRHLSSHSLALTKQINVEVMVAVAASRGEASAAPGVVTVPRSGLPSLLLLIAPMRPVSSSIRGAAVMFIYEPGLAPRARAPLVASLFGLSSAEAELAVALCAGLTLDEAAAQRGTTVHTARSQLKTIFNKTGTRRQADLLGLLLSSPAYFAAL